MVKDVVLYDGNGKFNACRMSITLKSVIGCALSPKAVFEGFVPYERSTSGLDGGSHSAAIFDSNFSSSPSRAVGLADLTR